MKLASRIIYIVLLVLVLFVLTALMIPQLFGVKVKAVVSGSMEPEIPVGSIVYVVPTQQVVVGDVVTYKTKTDVYVTHKVIYAEDGVLQTQGTANDVADAPITADSILGKVRLHIPLLGYVVLFVSSGAGKLIALIAVAALVAIAFILDSAAASLSAIAAEEEKTATL